MDEKARFIEPTVVVVNDVNDSLLKEESFGPLIPILAVDNLEQAISIANSIQSTPLALYPFGNKKETAKILTEIRSGGASINEFVPPSALGFLRNARPSLITPPSSKAPTSTAAFPPSPLVALASLARAPIEAKPVSTASPTNAASPQPRHG